MNRRLLMTLIAVVGAIGLTAQPVAAGGSGDFPMEELDSCDFPTNSCASAYVDWSGTVMQFNQKVQVAKLGRATFIPLAWNDGYIGVQKSGNSVSGRLGSTAVFSLGGEGVKIRKLPNGNRNRNCEGGFDGDAGASCRIHLNRKIQAGDAYRYKVTQVVAPSGKVWFRGQIKLTNGQWLWIADLRKVGMTDIQGLYNFIEYFGQLDGDPTPQDVPYSQIIFSKFGGEAVTFIGVSRLTGVCAQAFAYGPSAIQMTFGAETICTHT